MDVFRGLGFGLCISIPLWAVIIFVGIALAGCGRHDDGTGDLWRAVKYVEERR